MWELRGRGVGALGPAGFNVIESVPFVSPLALNTNSGPPLNLGKGLIRGADGNRTRAICLGSRSSRVVHTRTTYCTFVAVGVRSKTAWTACDLIVSRLCPLGGEIPELLEGC